jgi:hypothetical protein
MLISYAFQYNMILLSCQRSTCFCDNMLDRRKDTSDLILMIPERNRLKNGKRKEKILSCHAHVICRDLFISERPKREVKRGVVLTNKKNKNPAAVELQNSTQHKTAERGEEHSTQTHHNHNKRTQKRSSGDDRKDTPVWYKVIF